jgi:DNA-binding response OmpR family regulator
MDKWNILVIDDELVYHKLIRIMLRDDNFNVVHFIDYNELKSFLTEFKENNLMIVDYHLNEHTGANYVRALRKDGIEPYFIAVTSSENEEIKREMRELGAKAFFRKDDNFVRDLPSVINGLIKLKASDKDKK